MRNPKHAILALSLAAALPARAADPAPDTKKELDTLKARVAELEAKARQSPARAGEGGMTAEQKAELDRISVKTEALEDGRDASGLKGFKISAYLDPSYVYSVNKGRGTFQFVVPIGKEAYSYDVGYFGTLALDIVKETDSGTRFRFTLYPKRGGADVMGENGIVHEASVWIPLVGLKTKLFAGQLPDWSGYEYYAPNQYKTVTHNLLFDFTLPASYTGFGLQLIRGKWDMKFMLANLNASIRSVGESVPMLAARGDYTGGEFWGIGYAGALGHKPNFRAFVDSGFGLDPASGVALRADGTPVSAKDTLYATFEVDGWYTRGDLTLNGHVSYGRQAKASITADPTTGDLRDSSWVGVSALAAWKFTPRLEGALRADYVYNQSNGGGLLDYVSPDAVNGIGPDPAGDPEKGAGRYAITACLAYALNSNVTLKLEYRYDGADKKVFGNEDTLTGGASPKMLNNNSLVSTAVVFAF